MNRESALSSPNVEILIENRCGSVYHGGKFILSRMKDVAAMCERIEIKDLKLMIAFDIPQIYTAHSASSEDKYLSLLREVKGFRRLLAESIFGERVTLRPAEGHPTAEISTLTLEIK